ncbi:hypothetical protein KQI76_05995 [Amphibacillus sp. MSJ-3]|uniref:hypothetical protein n=1 Tax=Amphibacillus sp. MSJ-3 TaxID=2841505 RepID=UPI001C0EABAA|nr:hypothetical protein [Amphibacillus sp. MSJ-3]MBU5594709.1 hypothetical protein [Amphibacillus sp. MSJ-3]
MDQKEREQFLIEQYQAGEDQMILLFTQWCFNHDLDAIALYQEAYPNQLVSTKLLEINNKYPELKETAQIDTSLLLEVLQLYENYDLAFVVSNYADQLKRK